MFILRKVELLKEAMLILSFGILSSSTLFPISTITTRMTIMSSKEWSSPGRHQPRSQEEMYFGTMEFFILLKEVASMLRGRASGIRMRELRNLTVKGTTKNSSLIELKRRNKEVLKLSSRKLKKSLEMLMLRSKLSKLNSEDRCPLVHLAKAPPKLTVVKLEITHR